MIPLIRLATEKILEGIVSSLNILLGSSVGKFFFTHKCFELHTLSLFEEVYLVL